jgi:hypothetical protein
LIIVTMKAPEGGINLVRKYAPLILGKATLTGLAVEPEIGAPWPLYLNTNEKLLEGKVVIGTRLSAWEYPLFSGNNVLGLARLSADPILQWSALLSPEYAERTLARIYRAQSIPITDANPYDLRAFEIPSISLRAVWLHGPDNIFLPLPLPMRPGAPEPPEDMNEITLMRTFSSIATVRLTAAFGSMGA